MTATLSQLAADVHDLAVAHGSITIATAESCTGGNIAHQITLNAGSSAYFVGGVVSYANHVKEQVLGVPAEVLVNPGAVSEPCALAMAEGVRRLLGADLAVATTGIAGPAGGTARKPVGLVYIGLASASGTIVEKHVFPGSRAEVIEAATRRALELLQDALTAARSDLGRLPDVS
ncbi:MAG TPA: CinA family protein [Thermomicrobiales bacterium]|nr:CinA family protein [Thermomicrobiales bacterium]